MIQVNAETEFHGVKVLANRTRNKTLAIGWPSERQAKMVLAQLPEGMQIYHMDKRYFIGLPNQTEVTR